MTSRAERPRRRASAWQVLGEVILTVGVLCGLFVVWQVFINNEVSGTLQHAASDSLSKQWAAETPAPGASSTAEATVPVIASKPAADAAFANLIVPRFGADFSRPISQGVGFSVLNNVSKGIGHYVESALPGQVGNFAIASHRSAYGGAFHLIHHLRVGDPIYIETQDGWYEYSYRDTEYVLPTGVGVVAAVPQSPDATPAQRLLTMTTCNPFYSSAERMAAYAVFQKFYPRADGPPADIAAVAKASS
ncbi:class E sortase [soil metagenome]